MSHTMNLTLRHPNAKIPKHATDGSAGRDLVAVEDVVIPAGGKSVLVDTGISLSFPKMFYARIAPRSGLALKHCIHTGAGVVDSDYRGSIGVVLYNLGDEDYQVKSGDKVAQLIFEQHIHNTNFLVTEDLPETDRGEGGYGSTDEECDSEELVEVILYTKDDCPNCVAPKKLIEDKGLSVTITNVSEEPEVVPELKSRGLRGVPALDVGGKLITGDAILEHLKEM